MNRLARELARSQVKGHGSKDLLVAAALDDMCLGMSKLSTAAASTTVSELQRRGTN